MNIPIQGPSIGINGRDGTSMMTLYWMMDPFVLEVVVIIQRRVLPILGLHLPSVFLSFLLFGPFDINRGNGDRQDMNHWNNIYHPGKGGTTKRRTFPSTYTHAVCRWIQTVDDHRSHTLNETSRSIRSISTTTDNHPHHQKTMPNSALSSMFLAQLRCFAYLLSYLHISIYMHRLFIETAIFVAGNTIPGEKSY